MNDEILQGYSISDYLAATENKGWNPDTRRYYTNCLHDLLAFTVQHGVPTPKTMAEWEQSLEQVYTRSAVNVHLAAANNYFKWCGRYDLLRGHTRVTEEQERSPTLTRTEYLKLLRTARSLGKHRIYLLIKLFATTGVPIQCLNQVTAELVKQGSGTLKYRDGAFGFRCPPALQQELLAYMAENGIYRGPVFITRTGQPACRRKKATRAACATCTRQHSSRWKTSLQPCASRCTTRCWKWSRRPSAGRRAPRWSAVHSAKRQIAKHSLG